MMKYWMAFIQLFKGLLHYRSYCIVTAQTTQTDDIRNVQNGANVGRYER